MSRNTATTQPTELILTNALPVFEKTAGHKIHTNKLKVIITESSQSIIDSSITVSAF